MRTLTSLIVTALLTTLVSCLGGGANEMLGGNPVVLDTCQAEGSLAVNCGFNSNVMGWDINADSFAHVSDDGATGVGCIELTYAQNISGIVWIGQCIPVEPNRLYGFEASVRVVAGQIDNCELSATAYSTTDCSGAHGAFAFRLFTAAGSWAQTPTLTIDTTRLPGVIGPDNQSALFGVNCRASSPLTVRFDSVFVGP